MSNAALTAVKAWYSAISERDWTTLRSLVDPEMEFVVADGFPAGGRYVGPEQIFDTFFPASFASWSAILPEVDEIFAVAGENVVVRGRYVGRTKVTDTPFDVPFAHLWRARDGKLVGLRQYIDTAVLRDAIEGRAAVMPTKTVP
ncbi:nuclear transport factor 2 family protein [Amycolatopsis mongoliensis]|uniref:Nuclear transport factor 2 family protein n=1 Tax=Amycolatopsis mongoliensis TaxID=715475 RepID=A0A9Y2NG43_9PSEU|nr:nuclear transport factor 2 family protein [Amycolatopsis sp. 4-36]WIX98292.1 nuclear transport factor 2 family protein [Amycolatopsis sp. 4-36]